ncbi:MAG: RtcB family protein [Bacteroidetes bacterium]|nr:RtcB family protein [Bacteroidota bacterium]MCW5894690.1 RtcB family protein [Bacteroidota bacterium]
MNKPKYKIWGSDIDPEAKAQMETAASLPISVAGALMPDAHVGYGLPIGGVLATDNAVIPYGVGVDIACRMMMTIFDVPPKVVRTQEDLYKKAIEENTRFGVGAEWKNKKQHDAMDEDWNVSPVTREMKDKAHRQLGTSGSGNHFVEFGEITFEEEALGIPAGSYLALLSHSGSRGTGAQVADYYTRIAKQKHPELIGAARNLAWLDVDEEGAEYWAAMELMGKYASANHHLIHEAIIRFLKHDVLKQIENHHNFAWREKHGGRNVIVHRKGATPAGKGILGIIPGSMGTPGFLVEGLGSEESLASTSHGAGRRMSRKQASKTYTWKETKEFLEKQGVKLLSAGLDEVPWAYKNINDVMNAQLDLAKPLAKFMPRLVKMAPAGERPED